MGDTLNAFENNNTTGKADFSNGTKAQVGGMSMGKKWDKNILELMKRKNEKDFEVRKEENKPALSNINCIKTDINHDSFIPPAKDKIERVVSGPLSKLAHREKVFSEIKLFYMFN